MIHSKLKNFELDVGKLGPSAPFARSREGRQICEALMEASAFAALLGAIDAASSRPPQPALDRYVLQIIDAKIAVSHEAKTYIGRVVRQCVEHIGGRWVRSGVPVTVPSTFANGSIYTLPNREKGKPMKPVERLAWAENQAMLLKSDR